MKEKHMRIHIRVRIPSTRQIVCDAADTILSAIGILHGICRPAETEKPYSRMETADLSDGFGSDDEIDIMEGENFSDEGNPAGEQPAGNESDGCGVKDPLGWILQPAESGIKKICDAALALKEDVRRDLDAICSRDPAARSRTEVLLLYSGLHALVFYRASHALYQHGLFFPARLISQGAKFLTGIEIHPGAQIGQGLFIDHGSGVVIGETTIIGDNCTLYQGVTLGGTGKETGKRHPTLGNNVMVGAGAKLLGNFTVGDNAKIAAGAVVLGDVPPDCTAVGIPARVVRRAGERVDDLDQTHIPDPVSQEFCRIGVKIDQLEAKLNELQSRTPDTQVD